MQVLREGVWAPASARLLLPEDAGYQQALTAYCDRWEHVGLPAEQPLVLVHLGGPHQDT